MPRERLKVALILAASTMLAAAAAHGDNAPPPPEPDPPHAASPGCTVQGLEEGVRECVRCTVPRLGALEACRAEWEPWGFWLACGDLWDEVWCRSFNDYYDYERPDVPDEVGDAAVGDGGCTVTSVPGQDVPTQVALALLIVGIGLSSARWWR